VVDLERSYAYLVWRSGSFLSAAHQLSENSANRGHALDSFTVLADLQGASVRHLAPAVISIAQKRTKLEEAHYPEVAKRYGCGLRVEIETGPRPLFSFPFVQRVYHSRTPRVCGNLQLDQANACGRDPGKGDLSRLQLVSNFPALISSQIFVLAGDYQETLRKYISPEQIPRMFGGACDCHDAECRGKWVLSCIQAPGVSFV
jgi:hypothetical protein